jgi:hypothetical protein
VLSTLPCLACGAPTEQTPHKRRRKWCSERCRKSQYAGTCDTCGGPTDGTTPSRGVATRCAVCIQWTPEGVLEALRDWGEDHGGVPPRCVDAQPDGEGHGRLPYELTVRKHFGGWNVALLAAGYGALHCDRRPETAAAILAAVRAGERTADIADRFGVTPAAIHERMKARGTTVRRERAAA